MGYRTSITGTIGGSRWDEEDIYRLSATKRTKMDILFEPKNVFFPYGRPGLYINVHVMGFNEISGHWETLADDYGQYYEKILLSFTASDHPDYLFGIRVLGPEPHFSFESFDYEIKVRMPGEDPIIRSVSSFSGNNAVLLLWTVKGELSRIKELDIYRTLMEPDGDYDDDGLERIVSLEPEVSHYIDPYVSSGHYYHYRLTLVPFDGENITWSTSVAFFLDERDRDLDMVVDEIEHMYGFSERNGTDGLEDSDNDGFPNYEEIERYSNPFDVSSVPGGLVCHEIEGYLDDKDMDGIPDEWEKSHSLDTFDSSDAKMDPDRDGRTNLEEFKDRTDPHDRVEKEKGVSTLEKAIDSPWIRSMTALLILSSLLAVVILLSSRKSRSIVTARRDGPSVMARKTIYFPPKS